MDKYKIVNNSVIQIFNEYKIKDIPHKFLLVDDEPLLHLLFSTYLVNLGAKKENIKSVNNGKECIEVENIHEYDVILLDINMPLMNGFEACDYLRHKLNYKGFIWAITGIYGLHDYDKAYDSGFNHITVKPVSVQDFVETFKLYKIELI